MSCYKWPARVRCVWRGSQRRLCGGRRRGGHCWRASGRVGRPCSGRDFISATKVQRSHRRAGRLAGRLAGLLATKWSLPRCRPQWSVRGGAARAGQLLRGWPCGGLGDGGDVVLPRNNGGKCGNSFRGAARLDGSRGGARAWRAGWAARPSLAARGSRSVGRPPARSLGRPAGPTSSSLNPARWLCARRGEGCRLASS